MFFPVFILILFTIYNCEGQQYDCNRPPQFSPQTLKGCCNGSSILTDDLVKQCGHHLRSSSSTGTGSNYGRETTGAYDGYVGTTDTGEGSSSTFMNRPIESFFCFAECILNATGVLENGEINEESFKDFLTTTLEGQPDFLNLYMNSLDGCIGNAKEKARMTGMSGMGAHDYYSTSCRPYPGMVLGCVMANGFINCPPNKWKSSYECNNMREFVRACKN